MSGKAIFYHAGVQSVYQQNMVLRMLLTVHVMM